MKSTVHNSYQKCIFRRSNRYESKLRLDQVQKLTFSSHCTNNSRFWSKGDWRTTRPQADSRMRRCPQVVYKIKINYGFVKTTILLLVMKCLYYCISPYYAFISRLRNVNCGWKVDMFIDRLKAFIYVVNIIVHTRYSVSIANVATCRSSFCVLN